MESEREPCIAETVIHMSCVDMQSSIGMYTGATTRVSYQIALDGRMFMTSITNSTVLAS